MALITEIKKNVTDATPVFAAFGVTDLAVEKVRDARVRATAARSEFDVNTLQAKATKRVNAAAEQAQQVPALALNRGLELAGKAQESYEGLAARGEKLVKRVRTQKSTKDLLAQAETTFALGKGAVTTVRKAAVDIERSAKATLTTGRKEAVAAADTIADSVLEETQEATTAVKQSAARTRTAAKRTATTTRKSAATARTSAKRTTTGARKTAASAKKASTAAATKVGD